MFPYLRGTLWRVTQLTPIWRHMNTTDVWYRSNTNEPGKIQGSIPQPSELCEYPSYRKIKYKNILNITIKNATSPRIIGRRCRVAACFFKADPRSIGSLPRSAARIRLPQRNGPFSVIVPVSFYASSVLELL